MEDSELRTEEFVFDYALIPLAAVLASAAFGAVSIAWDSDRRATRSMGALFLCTGGWGLLDLAMLLETDPERALAWMRWSHVAPLMVGPSVLWLVAESLPQVRDRLARQARVGAVVCLAVAVALALTPGAIESVAPSAFGGWRPVWGWPSILAMPLGIVLPVHAVITASRARAREGHRRRDRARAWGLRTGVAFSIGLALPTELLLPLAGIEAPRLGAVGVTLAAAFVWLSVLHDSDELLVTPRGVARALLARLQDGVALVQTNGVVLSSNVRFAELMGRSGESLVGFSLDRLIDAPLERIRGGVENREARLYVAGGGAIPVSLSSSVARSRSGAAIGIVLVVRDLREVDALRGQLLGSGRLAAIGELAAGIAHEVNNPVAFIRSDLNLLMDRLTELRGELGRGHDPEHALRLLDRTRGRVAAALSGTERVAQVVVDVREFAHVGGPGQGGSDVATVVDGAMRLARLQRRDEVRLERLGDGAGERIPCGQELKQILLALLRTLADHCEKDGVVQTRIALEARALTLSIEAGPITGPVGALTRRFEAMGEPGFERFDGDLGLVIAGELVERLGGRFEVGPPGFGRVRLRLSVPRDGSGADA